MEISHKERLVPAVVGPLKRPGEYRARPRTLYAKFLVHLQQRRVGREREEENRDRLIGVEGVALGFGVWRQLQGGNEAVHVVR